MKKLLLSALAAYSLFTATAANPTLNWAYAIDTKYANDQIGVITKTSDNKTVSVSHFASQVDGDNFTYNDDVIGATIATSAENRNLVVIKHNTDGTKIWAVYSKQGYFDSANSSAFATSDGGVLLYAKTRGSQVATDTYEQPKLIDATGAEIDFPEFPTLNWTYNTVLVKISGEGAVEWIRQLAMDELPLSGATAATTDGITPYGVAVDGDGNIFIGGNFRAPIILKGQKNSNYVIQPRNATSSATSGGLYIIKLDKNGDYAAQVSVSGKATRDQICGLVYDNGNIYFAGNVQGADGDIVTVGDKSITLENDLDGIIYGSVSASDLSANFLGYAKAFGYSEDGKHTTQIKAVRVFDGNIYVTGSVKGGFGAANATEAVASSETKSLDGYVLKVSATDGSFGNVKVQTAKNGSTVVISNLFDVFKYNGKIYTFGYAMNAALGISVAEYTNDTNWELENQYYLIAGGGTPTTAAGVAIFDDGNITVSGRGNKDFTFLGSESKITPIDSKYGCVIASFNLKDESSSAADAVAATTSYSSDKNSVIVKASEETQVTIYNAAGVQVASQKVAAGTTHIALPQGIYLVNNAKLIVG